MEGLKEGLYESSDPKLVYLIQQLSKGIYNGSLTIVKQDSVVIQINTYEKFLLDENY